MHFLCEHRSSISTKNLPPHWGWQQQHSCSSRERTEQGRLSGAVTATSTTRHLKGNPVTWKRKLPSMIQCLSFQIQFTNYTNQTVAIPRKHERDWDVQHRIYMLKLELSAQRIGLPAACRFCYTGTAGAIPIWCRRFADAKSAQLRGWIMEWYHSSSAACAH